MHYGERFEQALVFAARLHRDHVRKGSKVPYITHLLAVAALVGEAAGTENEVIGALLHDAAEDQGGEQTLASIREQFGESVATIVRECSDTLESPKPSWEQRKQHHLQQLEAASPASLLVVCADKLHNLRALLGDVRESGEAAWKKFNAPKDRCLWYYESVYRILEQRGVCPRMVEALREVLDQLQQTDRPAPIP